MITDDKLDNFFVSNKFNITTSAIVNLKNSILKWISDGIPGAIIYGRPRIGKTRAIIYIASSLKEKYKGLPIYVLNATEHVAKDKYFYSELLKTVGHSEYEKGTVTVMKNRLINTLLEKTCCTDHRKIILFIDEAYNFSDKDFKWLMDISNNLNLLDIHLTVFLVGTEELLARKQAFILAGQQQIIGRFMVSECHFHGIQTLKDMSICLLNFDQNMNIYDDTQEKLTEYYFPEAFGEGKRLAMSSTLLMDQYIKIMKEVGIPKISEIPMMYFINTIKYCFNYYGVNGKKIYFPDEEIWHDSILNSGYVDAERLFSNVSYR